jgi:hypothetical protein
MATPQFQPQMAELLAVQACKSIGVELEAQKSAPARSDLPDDAST